VDDEVTLDEILLMIKTVQVLQSAKEPDSCSCSCSAKTDEKNSETIVRCGKRHVNAMCTVGKRDVRDEIAEYVVQEVMRATGCSKEVAHKLYSQ
jgi:hypothetical protein